MFLLGGNLIRTDKECSCPCCEHKPAQSDGLQDPSGHLRVPSLLDLLLGMRTAVGTEEATKNGKFHDVRKNVPNVKF